MSTAFEQGIGIIGVGHHLPSIVEDNATLCERLDVTPEWIVEKTGIERRHLAAPGDTATGYALAAARRALGMAQVDAAEIDLIICCTFSGDYIFPPMSAKLHHDLGAKGAQIYDLQANCTGVVTGLTAAADRMLVDGTVRNALVVGVELCSRYVDRSDVNTAIYLSDGAGAVVLGRRPAGQGIKASAFFTDSSNYESVRMRGGGSSFPIMGRAADPTIDHMEMNGIATWKQAITHLPTVMRRCAEKSGVQMTNVDFLVFHQANLRLLEYIVRKMGLGLDKTYTNVQDIGNTGSASLAIALSQAVERGLVKPGALVMLAAVGAGFNFGASLWRWDLPVPAASASEGSAA
ncbi:3-oxoacyl-ACP synthase III family protein [Piscinibacter koreensis]|uniref:Ketoacyl-ACP synthase III n=1 Tax=Piscinibacter koreensis TaxID=2742824 RepID=A0A7Y6TYF2_9BURK|nr:ketoacyl-ACP synthase III [Schlegelella koreensis]NUZ08193.1 ketoacyl-ACP synthase III [Schlegelella koreensis]